MKLRLLALVAAVCLMCCCTACRVRVDLSGEQTDEDGSSATTTTPPVNNDEMAAEAWNIYSRALDLESEYTTYELTYKARLTMGREQSVTNARIVRIEEDGNATLLVESEVRGTYSSGYLKDGVGYFFKDGKKYWMPTDEDGFFDTMGFTTTEPLTEEMFATAIVMRDAAGGATVSCPLAAQYATDFAKMHLGSMAQVGTVSHAEAGVTVDAEGYPLTFTAAIEMQVAGYGAVTMQSENNYVAFGEDVVITPPADLDEYMSIIDE